MDNQFIIDDFSLLSQNGNIGIYNQCEVTEIFGFKDNQPFNLYTLVVFQNSFSFNNEEIFLTDNLIELTNSIKFGIRKKKYSITDIQYFFNNLLLNREFELEKNKLSSIGNIEFNTKQFVAPNSSFDIQLNKIVKNNFNNGSYIIEGFDTSKDLVKFLFNNKVLNKFNLEVMKVIPINLMSITDRLGNIIFQFPSNILNHQLSVNGKKQNINLKLFWNKAILNKPNISFVAYNKSDNITTGFTSKSNIKDKEALLINSKYLTEYYIYNSDKNLILSSSSFNTINSINFEMGTSSPQQRVFKLNNKIEKVFLSSPFTNSTIGNSEKDDSYWIRNRMYDNDLENSIKNKSFIQYLSNSNEKALLDLRELISKYAKNGVYLWDPYLSAKDIKSTLYFSSISNAPLKAITGLKQVTLESEKEKQNNNYLIECFKKLFQSKKKKTNKKVKEIEYMREIFNQDDKEYLFMNLEVRGTYKYGNDFHDRFLIFPNKEEEKAKVWSLGISVNQVGESHHIFQEVKNPQYIVDTFNELWNKLEHKESIIWKSTKTV